MSNGQTCARVATFPGIEVAVGTVLRAGFLSALYLPLTADTGTTALTGRVAPPIAVLVFCTVHYTTCQQTI